jgi:polygalacturonase
MRSKLLAAVMGALLVSPVAADDSWTPPNIPEPQIPDHVFNINDYGAVADGKTSNTQAIAGAIAECAKAGGGKVIVPAGTYFTGPIDLVSNLELHFDDGATLLFSNDKTDYPFGTFKSLPTRYRPLIAAENQHDIVISGKGKLDGQGQPWWEAHRALGKKVKEPGYADPRPKMLVFESCKRIKLQGITLTNSPMFHISPTHCEDVIADGVTVIAPSNAPNTDSFNPSGWNFIVKNCLFDVGDDNIAVKPFHKPGDGRLSVENLYILNCTFRHGHGLSIGGQTPGGLRNMHVRDCVFEDTDNGIRMKSNRTEGGLVENLSYENITMKNVRRPIDITSYYRGLPKGKDSPQPVDEKTPIWRNIRISNVTATGCTDAGFIRGLPESPIENLVLENVSIEAQKPMRIGNAKGLMFKDVKINVKQGEPVVIEDTVQGEGLPVAATPASP